MYSKLRHPLYRLFMLIRKIICLLVGSLYSLGLTAQTPKNVTHIEQLWFGYFNQTRLSKHWGLWADLHLRTKENFFDNFSQSIFRPGLTYYVNDLTRLTFGYAYINNYPGDNHANVTQPEHRIWQQVQWHNRYPRLRLMQWVRLEERYKHNIKNNDELADGYQFNWRIRYNFFLNFPLGQKAFAPHTISAVLNNEVHVNFGKNIVYNYFDQNRFFVGFSYHVNKTDNFQFGYMNVFQQLSSGNSYKSLDAVRLFYFHNLDLRLK
jgi:hypothetical protein